MRDSAQSKITLDALKDLPTRKARLAFVYLNARRYGLAPEQAKRCALAWQKVMATCFTQAVAGELYNNSTVRAINFPAERSGTELYTTAHFSAYTLVPIVLARTYDRPVYILVGKPPVEWEETLVASLADAGVKGTVIKSDFSQLKRVKRAMQEDAIILSLIDVPWHRDNTVQNRQYQTFDMGLGRIVASQSIFKIADALGMTPKFVLCEPQGDGFDVVHHGSLSQADCFKKLATAVEHAPEHFERFCELQQYYEGGADVKELVTFQIDGHRFIVDSTRRKYWKLGDKLSSHIDLELKNESQSTEVTRLILGQMRKSIGQDYNEVVYF